MTVPTAYANSPSRGAQDCRFKSSRNFHQFPARRVELRQRRPCVGPITSPQLEIQVSVQALKKHFGFNAWSPAVSYLTRGVFADEHLIRVSSSEDLHTDQRCSHDHCMNAVDPHSVKRMEIAERLPICTCERHVVPKLGDCAARLDTAHNIALRQVLMLKAHLGRSK